MQLSNIRFIYMRELRDQLRDRRTLFTVLILPLLLYPLLGVSFIRISQFMRAHPTRCWVVGYQNQESLGIQPDYAFPSLLVDDAFNSDFCPEEESALLTVKRDTGVTDALQKLIDQAIRNPDDESNEGVDRRLKIQNLLIEEQVDLLLYFPPYPPGDPRFPEQIQKIQRFILPKIPKRFQNSMFSATWHAMNLRLPAPACSLSSSDGGPRSWMKISLRVNCLLPQVARSSSRIEIWQQPWVVKRSCGQKSCPSSC